jgi:hypothetical protein
MTQKSAVLNILLNTVHNMPEKKKFYNNNRYNAVILSSYHIVEQ